MNLHPELRALMDAENTAARRATTALGRLIVAAFALTVALVPAATWPGTWASAAGLTVGALLLARLLYVATFKEHQ